MEIATLKGAVYNKFETYTKFAVALGWKKQRLSKIVTGGKIPNVIEVAEMAGTLGLSVEQVAGFFLKEKSPNEQLASSQ